MHPCSSPPSIITLGMRISTSKLGRGTNVQSVASPEAVFFSHITTRAVIKRNQMGMLPYQNALAPPLIPRIYPNLYRTLSTSPATSPCCPCSFCHSVESPRPCLRATALAIPLPGMLLPHYSAEFSCLCSNATFSQEGCC